MELEVGEAMAMVSPLYSSPPSFIEGKSCLMASPRASGEASGTVIPLCRNQSNRNQLLWPRKPRREKAS